LAPIYCFLQKYTRNFITEKRVSIFYVRVSTIGPEKKPSVNWRLCCLGLLPRTHPREIRVTPMSCVYIRYTYVGWLLFEFAVFTAVGSTTVNACDASISAIVTAIGCS